MTNKIRTGLDFGIGTTTFFMSRALIPVIKGQEQTSIEIIKSAITALTASAVSVSYLDG